MAQQARTQAPKLGQELPREDNVTPHERNEKGNRKRVTQACETCRKNKVRCDQEKPSCTPCVTKGRSCHYDPIRKKRGLPAKLVDQLKADNCDLQVQASAYEKLLGLAVQDVDVGAKLLELLEGVKDRGGAENWNDEITTENLVATWKKSKASKELDRLLPFMEASPASPIKGKLKRKRGNDVEPTATAPETRAAQPSVNLSADVGDRNQTVPWPIFDSTESSKSQSFPGHIRMASDIAYNLMMGLVGGDQSQSPSGVELSNTYNQQSNTLLAQNNRRHQRSTSLLHGDHRFQNPAGAEQSSPHPHTLLAQKSRRHQRSISSNGMAIPRAQTPPNPHSSDHSLLLPRNYPSLYPTNPLLDPQLQGRATVSGADADLANEFAAMDATEWTDNGNWDHGLVNLGFAQDNGSQDFYDFCQQPDPLDSNNIFQQLAASSDIEASNFFGSSAFNGMLEFGDTFGWSGEMEGMHAPGVIAARDENEGIEASQILQSLSVPKDQNMHGGADN